MEQLPCVELIDDDTAWRETFADYLRSKGFRVLVAANSEQGLRLLRKGAVSIVVCDYNLPEENGLKLVKRIRASTVAVAILMLSNDEEPSLPGRVLAAGAQAFLTKTTPPHVLVQKIRQLTGEHRDTSVRHGMFQIWQRLLPSPFRNKQRASA
jgi:DNA-binding response OmpR family regulator